MEMEWPENCFCLDDVEIHLIAACKSGEAEKAEKYLKAGADLNARDRSNFYNQFIGFTQSALQVAVNHGHASVVEVLLRNGADIQLRDRFGFNALHLACKKGHIECADVLLRHGADLMAVRQDGERAIHYSAVSGNPVLIKRLIHYGANPNESDVYGYNPLSYAASNGHIEACRVLHENGANAKSKHIMIAYKKCYAEIVLFLFLHATEIDEEVAPKYHLEALYGESFSDLAPSDQYIVDEFGRTLLHVACKANNLSAVEYALKESDSLLVMKEDFHGLTALHYVCEPRSANFRHDAKSASDISRGDPDADCAIRNDFIQVDLEILKLLIQAGADVNYLPPHNEWTALCHACYIGDLNCVKALIEYGTDVNAGRHRYPLLTAVSGKRSAIVKTLLEAVANPNVLGSSFDQSWSPLHLAVHNNDPETTKLLLDHKADPNILDRNLNQTPLHLVNGQNGADLVRLLLRHGANVNSLKKHDESPLHSACQNITEDVAIVKALIAGGADLNAPGWFDRTPLHYACERGHANIVVSLVEAGAQADAREGVQNPRLHTLEGRFTYDLDTGTMKHAHFTPLASLLKYYLDLRKNTSTRVLKACRALIDVQSPDCLLDLTSEEWAKNLHLLNQKCPRIVPEILVSLCGSAKPLELHADILVHFTDRLQWFCDNFEVTQKLCDYMQSVVELSYNLEFSNGDAPQLNRVKSLQSWSRICVRKVIRQRRVSMLKSIESLPIPKPLKSFLLVSSDEGTNAEGRSTAFGHTRTHTVVLPD